MVSGCAIGNFNPVQSMFVEMMDTFELMQDQSGHINSLAVPKYCSPGVVHTNEVFSRRINQFIASLKIDNDALSIIQFLNSLREEAKMQSQKGGISFEKAGFNGIISIITGMQLMKSNMIKLIED